MASRTRCATARTWIGLLSIVALLLGLLPFAPAAAQDAVNEADATLRVIHASPGLPDIDVLLDGQSLLQSVPYGKPSDYVVITPQEHRLQVVPTGQTANAAVVDETLDATPGQAYLLAVYGLINNVGGAIYPVDLNEIDPGTVRVRLINFSPDAGEVDLLETGGDQWFYDVELGEATDYSGLAPNTYSVDLRGPDDRVLRTVPALTLAETSVYDLIVLGQVADDSLTIQALETSVSPPCTDVLGLDGAGSDACVRLVHAAPDSPPVDIYVNEAEVAKGIEYGTATEYTVVPSGGDRAVRVTAANAPLEEAVIDTNLDFDPGQAYELLVTGSGDDLGITITGTDLRPLPEGQARLRLIHASPDAGVIDLGVKGSETNLFEGVDFGGATHYAVVDAGDYPLEVRPGGEDMNVALQSDTTLNEGAVYDFVLLGRPADQSLTLLALTAPAEIRVGDVATPHVVSSGATVAETVVPTTIASAAGTATPTP